MSLLPIWMLISALGNLEDPMKLLGAVLFAVLVLAVSIGSTALTTRV